MALQGLTLSANKQTLLNSARFRNIGINYPGGIVRIYTQPSATACEYTPGAEQDAMLDLCVAMKVKVIRVKATPFWPAQWRYGVNGGVAGVAATSGDRAAHYAKIDDFLTKCEARGIGVILNLFFRIASVPDLAGQTLREGWLTSGSATRNYAQAVTQEIVTRYLTRQGVYGYEFSNEVNHYNDANDATRGSYPGVSVSYGTPASYSAANDIFNGLEWSGICAWWYGVVVAIDSQRIILTGNGPCSYSQPGGVAGLPSPLATFYQEQVRDNPTNCGSIHFYGNIACTSASFRGFRELMSGANTWQRKNGRGFVLGEFGNQPWTVTNAVATGGILTLTVAASCPIEVGDDFVLSGIDAAINGQVFTVATINAGRTSITCTSSANVAWAGSVKGLQFMSVNRLQRMIDDIIAADVDMAMLWMIDSDAGRPILEAVNDTLNAGQQSVILEANKRLGW